MIFFTFIISLQLAFKFNVSVTKILQLLWGGALPSDPTPGLRPWTPLGNFAPGP